MNADINPIAPDTMSNDASMIRRILSSKKAALEMFVIL